MTPIEKAIETLGSQAALAKALSTITRSPVSQPRVHYWVTKASKIPAEMCGPIEVATGGRVKRSDLRPDLFLPESGHDESRS